MGMLKGKKDLEKYYKGIKLNMRHSIQAKCYECNGEEEGGVDCDVPNCPIYPFNPYKGIGKGSQEESQK